MKLHEEQEALVQVLGLCSKNEMPVLFRLEEMERLSGGVFGKYSIITLRSAFYTPECTIHRSSEGCH